MACYFLQPHPQTFSFLSIFLAIIVSHLVIITSCLFQACKHTHVYAMCVYAMCGCIW